jgi:uncharacterized protein (TIGR04255 family)
VALVASINICAIVNWFDGPKGWKMATISHELFPSSPRVIYGRAPLIQVICQLRFPQLLSIEGKPPVDFQERIRDTFPLLERDSNPFPPDLQAQSSLANYRFLTENRDYIVTLTSQSIALSTGSYTRWECFRDMLKVPLDALITIYRPSFFSRIGLRYQDAICRSAIDLGDTPWSELLRKEVLGELALPVFEAGLEDTAQRALKIRIPDGSGSILWRHGLGKVQNREELCYIIDIDLFTEGKSDVENAESILDGFNSMAGNAFRWSITPKLRDALGPVELKSV